MQHSEQPFLELDRARLAIDAMRQAGSLEDLEEHWKEYLRRLERVWNKSAHHFGKSPKWNGWQCKYLKLRKHDPLLSYFINARGADEHTVGEITERQQSRFDVKMTKQTAYVKSIVIENGIVTEVSGTGLAFEFQPARVRLLPITNRGIMHPLPTQHLSQPVDPYNLLEIAEKGVSFYADFLKEAEAFFIQPVPGNT